MKKLPLLFCVGCFLSLVGWTLPQQATQGVEATVAYFKKEADSFANSSAELQQAISAISNEDKTSIYRAKNALALCRQDYKKIEFFLTYFFPSASWVYNAPPVFEVEEPSLEFQEPMGLQQIESLLFDDDPVANKQALLLQAEIVSSSAKDLHALLYNFTVTDAQVLEALRMELIRVIALSITGYDAPQLKTGIKEANSAISAVRELLKLYIKEDKKEHEALRLNLDSTIAYLEANPDFDSFERMLFLTRYALPLQKQLGLLITDLGLDLNTNKLLNYEAESIFSKEAFNREAFSGIDSITQDLVYLGEQLFSEKALSANRTRSCKSCHIPEFYFTDKLPKNRAIDGHASLKRNTPSLLYSGLQHAQFWDGRSGSLTEQIETVILDAAEMNGSEAAIRAYLAKDTTYQKLFKAAFPATAMQQVKLKHVSKAIAAYVVENMNPMNSAFDQYMQGNTQALSKAQVNGFNLFTGKAQCATCHFMPLFNSLLPPDYALSEYEILGVTQSDDLNQPQEDKDLGRYTAFPVKFYKGAFKTPTVRNAAVTAPYMHNGAFRDLKAVVDFYNKGGGHGLGLTNDLQTLSSEPLNLTEKETDDIIQFIHSLTDALPTKANIQPN